MTDWVPVIHKVLIKTIRPPCNIHVIPHHATTSYIYACIPTSCYYNTHVCRECCTCVCVQCRVYAVRVPVVVQLWLLHEPVNHHHSSITNHAASWGMLTHLVQGIQNLLLGLTDGITVQQLHRNLTAVFCCYCGIDDLWVEQKRNHMIVMWFMWHTHIDVYLLSDQFLLTEWVPSLSCDNIYWPLL